MYCPMSYNIPDQRDMSSCSTICSWYDTENERCDPGGQTKAIEKQTEAINRLTDYIISKDRVI